MSPGIDCVAPSPNLLFGPGADDSTLLTCLPNRVLVDKVLAHYWQVVDIIVRTVHRPSFERDYQTFWKNVSIRVENRPSFQALLFSVLLISIISIPEEKVLADFGVEKQSLVDSFIQGTESALARAHLLRTTKLETLQAFVTYLVSIRTVSVQKSDFSFLIHFH